MQLDHERCRRIVESRDARYDGQFIHAVASTGIYCRPSCSARTPASRNSRFFQTAAAAQVNGFRACKRCRPDAVPGSPEWNLRTDVAARAMRLIEDGVVDREGVAGLARRLGYSERQLNRLLTAELGAGPLALARAQRAHVARLLIETTETPFTDIAFAAGFASVRQFNDTIRQVYGSTPSEQRVARRARVRRRDPVTEVPGSIRIRLPFRPPLDRAWLLGFFERRALTGIETVTSSAYVRTMRLPLGSADVALYPMSEHVECVVNLDRLADLPAAVARCRRLFDLDADPAALCGTLGPSGERIRLPGSVDAFEMVARAVVGQQISVAAARSTLGRIAGALGERRGERIVFPAPQVVAEADPATFGMPAARARTLSLAATAIAEGSLLLHPGVEREDVRRQLLELPGIGPWTAEYVCMRGLADPDADMSGDLGVRRALEAQGLPPDGLDDLRPWRSYGAIALWSGAPVPDGSVATDSDPTPKRRVR